MKMQENNHKKVNVRLWKRIVLIAAVFSLLTALLLIANYIQLNRADPVNTKTINMLVERLNQNPDDDALRNEIRELDLLARKAYFTNQWQIRTGAYLLLIGIIVVVVALQIIKSAKGIEPEIPAEKGLDFLSNQVITRKWVSISGISLVGIALLFAFLTHNKLGNAITQASTSTQTDTISSKLAVNSNNTIETSTMVSDSMTTSEVAENQDTATNENDVDTTTKVLSEYPTYKEIIQNFPCFRGPGGNGIAYQKNVPTSWDGASGANIKWKFAVPLPGFNSPVVWEDKVFISGANATTREVYCIDRNTGKLLWKAPVVNVPGSPGTSPKVTDDTGHAAPTLAVDGRRVYAIFSNGDIIALDMDGNKVWARNLGTPSNHYGHSSSLMLFNNMVIIQYDQKNSPKVMALSTTTGKTIWSTAREVKISWASPVIVYTGQQTEIILSSDPYVASYNPWSGKENWRIDCIFGEVGPSVAYADGLVFAQNEYARLVAIKIGEKPEILWESDEYLSDVPSPVATKDYLFSATSYGVVVCYEAKTCKKLWEQEFGNGFYSSPMMVGGRIYLFDRKGVAHIFSASGTYKSLGEPKLGEDVVSTPAFADGQLFIRGSKNLYCIGK
ncbi:MAG: PQQ-binding-like beta-propeller repeat protein [Bacteroidales bacterium]|nr:PQQ-binding-like beta-propeller repeat protein [Bacteroidales bacterium]